MKLIKRETYEATAEQFRMPTLPEGVECVVAEKGDTPAFASFFTLGGCHRSLNDGDWIIRGPGERVKVYSGDEFQKLLGEGWEPVDRDFADFSSGSLSAAPDEPGGG